MPQDFHVISILYNVIETINTIFYFYNRGKMKIFAFISLTLLSGAIAGALLGLINQGIVEPFIDKAIGIETQREISTGKIVDSTQQSQYRMWQKEGEIV